MLFSGTFTGVVTGLAQPGVVDGSFGAGMANASSTVSAVVPQADGSVIVGGWFTLYNTSTRIRIVRLFGDGRVDESFGTTTSGPDNGIECVTVQTNGKVLIGGWFGNVSAQPRGRVARLNRDGSLDSTFGSGLSGANNTIYAIAVQNNGKILIGGSFTNINGTACNRIARLNGDGSLDTSFGNGLAGADNAVRSVTVLTNGNIIIGGAFNNVNGTARPKIARLDTSGVLDTNFMNGLSGIVGVGVFSHVIQPDSRILIGGAFSTVNGVTRNSIGRLNEDGSLDNTFGNGLSGLTNKFGVMMLYSVALQSDGKVLIGGTFTNVNGTARSRIARLNSDGTLDVPFGAGFFGASNDVLNVAATTDGRVLIGGTFLGVNNTARSYIARLYGDRPPLSIARSGSTAKLSWPVGWTNFAPQSSSNVNSGWSNYGGSPASDGTNWVMSVPLTNASRYFRLVR